MLLVCIKLLNNKILHFKDYFQLCKHLTNTFNSITLI